MAATTADIPQFALPFRFQDGQPVLLEQDSPEEVAQCVEVIARTPLGVRSEHPDFGIVDPTFRREPDLEQLQDQIVTWEPRAQAALGFDLDLTTLVGLLSVDVAVSDG